MIVILSGYLHTLEKESEQIYLELYLLCVFFLMFFQNKSPLIDECTEVRTVSLINTRYTRIKYQYYMF